MTNNISNKELLAAINNGFTAIEQRIADMEQHLAQKIDAHAAINRRLSLLEQVHGIASLEQERIIQ